MPHLGEFLSTEFLVRDAVFSEPGHLNCSGHELLVYADTEAYLSKLTESGKASCAIITPALRDYAGALDGLAVCDQPRTEFLKVHSSMLTAGRYRSLSSGLRGRDCAIHASASIDPTADIGTGVRIGPMVSIGANCVIGDNVIIEAGVSIGVEGILYFHERGEVHHVGHAGAVVIHDNATLLAGSTIVRSVHPGYPTSVGARSIIGIGATIGHEAQVGEDVIISGNSTVARNARMQKGSFLGPHAFVSENLSVGEGARVVAGSIVIKSIKAGASVSGNFAGNHASHLRELTTRL